MKLARLQNFYSDYLAAFYRSRPKLESKSFAEQREALYYDSFACFDAWSTALRPLGYDVLEITSNAVPLQRQWAKENGMRTNDVRRITVEQVKRFKPDIIWYDESDLLLIRELKEAIPSARLVLGWSGSPVSYVEHFKEMDLVIACAPEAVTRLEARGIRATHMDHAFDPRINQRLAAHPKSGGLTFIGQIIRGSEFHSERERLLLALAENDLVSIHSPTRHQPLLDAGVRLSRFALKEAIRRGAPEKQLKSVAIFNRLLASDAMPFTIDKRLRRVLKPGVFGLPAYQLIHDSGAALNVHANSSPQFASNMRLFEITGVGTCMLCDWKENLASMFKPDEEVVTYRNVDECVEKARWLRDHPKERLEIGLRGQKRVLAEHTYERRALTLDRIIRRELERA